MRIILLGAPGAGKGTLASELSKLCRIPHVSTGDIFRQNIRDRTALGIDAEAYIRNGALIPDDITIALVSARLLQKDCQTGFLLDGFPRTVNQAIALDIFLNETNHQLHFVFDLSVREDLIIRRLSSRRVCAGCGRTYSVPNGPMPAKTHCDACSGCLIQRIDDQPETIQKRLADYHHQTRPVSDYYALQGLVARIENEGEIGATLSEVRRLLNQ